MYSLLLTAQRIQGDPLWQSFEVACGHVFWESVAEDVAAILTQFAGQ